MAASSESGDILELFLSQAAERLKDRPDPYEGVNSPLGQIGQCVLPARLRGHLAELAEEEAELSSDLIKKRAAVQARLFRLNSTVADNDLRELDRTNDVEQSNLRENWYRGLSLEDKRAFDDRCLALASPILALLPATLSACLHGPLARLALECCQIVKRFDARRKQQQQSLMSRGLSNHTIVDGFIRRLKVDQQKAQTNLIGRWLRELTPEQCKTFDRFHSGDKARPIDQSRGNTSNKPQRAKKLEARDKWIYEQCCRGTPHDRIVAELKRIALSKGWQVFRSKQRAEQIGKEYARRHEKPSPPPRQNN
jgi:hypothetical protein